MGRSLTLVLVAAALALLFIFVWDPVRRDVQLPVPAALTSSTATAAATASVAAGKAGAAQPGLHHDAPGGPSHPGEPPLAAPTPAIPAPTPAGASAPPAGAESPPTPVAPDDAPGGQRFTADPGGIRAAVQAAQPALRECYESWLAAAPGLAGKLTLQFTLRAAPEPGLPAEVSEVGLAESTVGHPVMEGCVLNAIQGLEFDPPPGGEPLQVRYPLSFSSPDAGAAD
jgi:hypothetical protein